jgi:hypothetical protein
MTDLATLRLAHAHDLLAIAGASVPEVQSQLHANSRSFCD